MKKNNKKICSVSLLGAFTVACSFVVAGCGQGDQGISKDALLESAATTFSGLKSVDADIDLITDLNIETEGFSMGIDVNADLNLKARDDESAVIDGDVNMKLLGQEQTLDLEGYTVKDGDDYLVYSKYSDTSDNGQWTVKRINESDDQDDLSELSLAKITELYNSAKDSLDDLTLQKGTVSYNNTECYLLSGVVNGGELSEIYEKLGNEISDEEKSQLEKIDIDTEIYFKKSDKKPYAVVADLSSAIKNAIALSESELADLDFDAGESKAVIIFNSFDTVGEIKVPQEVIDNAIETDDTYSIDEFMNII